MELTKILRELSLRVREYEAEISIASRMCDNPFVHHQSCSSVKSQTDIQGIGYFTQSTLLLIRKTRSQNSGMDAVNVSCLRKLARELSLIDHSSRFDIALNLLSSIKVDSIKAFCHDLQIISSSTVFLVSVVASASPMEPRIAYPAEQHR